MIVAELHIKVDKIYYFYIELIAALCIIQILQPYMQMAYICQQKTTKTNLQIARRNNNTPSVFKKKYLNSWLTLEMTI